MRFRWMATALLAAALTAQASTKVKSEPTLEEKVRHELVMLPYYGVFDDIRFQVVGDTVVLSGQVSRPVLKGDAQNVVKSIRGVEVVKNDIQVLPLSPFDDRIRVATARAIYSQNALSRYALSPRPSVHIIVENGNVRLTGFVANEFDRNLAYMKAMGVPGAFSVKNELQIDPKS
jgi:hyperosmotically inducible periplasmic protein